MPKIGRPPGNPKLAEDPAPKRRAPVIHKHRRPLPKKWGRGVLKLAEVPTLCSGGPCGQKAAEDPNLGGMGWGGSQKIGWPCGPEIVEAPSPTERRP